MENVNLVFSMLWEEMREELMQADLYRKRLKMIEDGRKFRTLLKDKSLTTLDSEKIMNLKEQQDKQYKKTEFYTGLLKAMNKGE